MMNSGPVFSSGFGDNNVMTSDFGSAGSFMDNSSTQSFSLSKGQIATGLDIASDLLEGYGKYEGLSQKADSYREQATLDRQKAAEIMRRADITLKKIDVASTSLVEKQKTSLIGRGIKAGGTLALALARDSLHKAEQEMKNVDTAARYERDLALAEAAANDRAADAADDAAFMTVLGTGLKVAGTAIGAFYGGPQGAAAGSAAGSGLAAGLS